MTHAVDLPMWVALPVAMLVLLGAALTFTGSIGLVVLRSFYDRVHAPTLGTTLGIGCVLLASILFFSVLHTRFVAHEVLITVFTVITTPVTLMLLTRAAVLRDQRDSSGEVPPRPAPRAERMEG
jgi:multicomponent K+:H+ antiporter subunit G